MQHQFDAKGALNLTTPSAAAAGLRTFFQIARGWSLTDDAQLQLLGCSRSQYEAWTSGQIQTGLDHATIERLSHVLGVYAALQQLLPIPERANAWIRRANTAPVFAGGSALDLMLAGQTSGLLAVRRHLEAQVGGSAS